MFTPVEMNFFKPQLQLRLNYNHQEGKQMVKQISLTDMETGQTGTVVEVVSGKGVYNRLRALGIRQGTEITKRSGTFGRGPVVLQVGGTQVALGLGISQKVIVEVER